MILVKMVPQLNKLLFIFNPPNNVSTTGVPYLIVSSIAILYFILTIISSIGLFRFKFWGCILFYALVPIATLNIVPLVPFVVSLIPNHYLYYKVILMVSINLSLLLLMIYTHIIIRKTQIQAKL